MRSKRYFLICGAVLVLVIITFTPLVIPYGIYKPELVGLPYSLWIGILISIVLVVLTFISTRIFLESESEDKE